MEGYRASGRAKWDGGSIPLRFQARRYASALGLILLTLAVVGGLAGCPRPGYVGIHTCLACHDGRSASNQQELLAGEHGATDCESCHGPGQLHVSSGGRNLIAIGNPARWASDQNVAFCARCHPQQSDEFLLSTHSGLGGGESCGICHDVHIESTLTAATEDNSLCLQCHASPALGFDSEEAIDFHTGDFHPVTPSVNGASRCIGCHLPPLQANDQDSGPHGHTMFTIPPSATNDAIAGGADPPPPNSCAGVAGCHDPAVPGSGQPHDPADTALNNLWQTFYDSIGGLPG